MRYPTETKKSKPKTHVEDPRNGCADDEFGYHVLEQVLIVDGCRVRRSVAVAGEIKEIVADASATDCRVYIK